MNTSPLGPSRSLQLATEVDDDDGPVYFGWEEQLTCIDTAGVKGDDGETLCVAFKTSKLFIVGGVFMKDDGYVLADEARDLYYVPAAEQLKAWQAQTLLPSPLPGYSIQPRQYLAGYSLWLFMLPFVAVAAVKRVKRRR